MPPQNSWSLARQNGCPMAIKLNSIPFLGPKTCMLAAEFLFFCSIPTALSGKALDGILPAQNFHMKQACEDMFLVGAFCDFAHATNWLNNQSET